MSLPKRTGHQCLWTHDLLVRWSKRLRFHADLCTVSRCCSKGESEDHTGEKACKWGIHPGFETHGRRHQKSKTRASVATCPPNKKELILRSFFCVRLKQPDSPSVPDSQMVNHLPPQHVSSVTSLRPSQPQLTQSDINSRSPDAHIGPFFVCPNCAFHEANIHWPFGLVSLSLAVYMPVSPFFLCSILILIWNELYSLVMIFFCPQQKRGSWETDPH